MKAEIFRRETRHDAWKAAARHVLAAGEALNIILEIGAPEKEAAESPKAYEQLNGLYAQAEQLPVHSVAETIFPGWQYVRHGPDGVYQKYLEEYKLLRKGRP